MTRETQDDEKRDQVLRRMLEMPAKPHKPRDPRQTLGEMGGSDRCEPPVDGAD